MKQALLLVAHGTVDDLDELPSFVARIRRGHPAPPELLLELRRRYDAIGGRSPLNEINRRLAERVEAATGVTTRVANRLARPFVNEVMEGLAKDGVTHVAAVPLAQYSTHVYAEAVEGAAKELGLTASCAQTWAVEPGLIEAYVDAIRGASAGIEDISRATVVLSAHSLPVAAIRAGDPYEHEFRAAADAVVARLASSAGSPVARTTIAFQSQGMSTGPGGRPVEWLGPELLATIDECRSRGDRDVIFAPIGFLADHVEILYDLDVEARGWVEGRGMAFHRTRSLNDGDALVGVIARIARTVLHA
jgi:ferrochelatase